MSISRFVLSAVPFVSLLACADVSAPREDQADNSALIVYSTHYTETGRDTIQGTRTPSGGCNFTAVATLQPGEEIFESVREVNLATCMAVLVRHPLAEVPAHAKPKRRTGDSTTVVSRSRLSYSSNETDSYETYLEVLQGGGAALSANPASPSIAASSSVSTCPKEIGPSHDAWQNLWHDDPIPTWVTKSSQYTLFFYNNTCVQWAKSWLTSEWRSATGWRLVDHQHSLLEQDPEWHRVDGVGFQMMQNPIFCAYSTNAT